MLKGCHLVVAVNAFVKAGAKGEKLKCKRDDVRGKPESAAAAF